MYKEDWPFVAQIFRQGIETGLATFTQEVPSYIQWDANHLVHCRIVGTNDEGLVIAWAALSPVSSRVAYRGVAEVSIYVGSEFRGKSVGKQMLEHLIQLSEDSGYWTLQSVILVGNYASIALHQSCGFRVVGRREKIGRLPDGTWSDTVLLERRSSSVETYL